MDFGPNDDQAALIDGWLGAALSEAAGGSGMREVEEMLVFQQLGRYLSPVGILPTILAGYAALAAGTTGRNTASHRGSAVRKERT